jgi:hypothetical protein
MLCKICKNNLPGIFNCIYTSSELDIKSFIQLMNLSCEYKTKTKEAVTFLKNCVDAIIVSAQFLRLGVQIWLEKLAYICL